VGTARSRASVMGSILSSREGLLGVDKLSRDD
jgi:hypothetical protein